MKKRLDEIWEYIGKEKIKSALGFSKKDYKNNKEQQAKDADRTIRNHAYWSVAAGLVPVPILDLVLVTGIQVDMLSTLCSIYGVEFVENQGKSWIGALVGTSLARYGTSIIKAIPGFGSIIGGVSMSVLSGASTFAVGQVFKLHFDAGGTLENFKPEFFKKFYEEKREEGKGMAKEFTQKAKDSAYRKQQKEISDKLKNIRNMRDQDLITEKEYQNIKGRLLDKLGDV